MLRRFPSLGLRGLLLVLFAVAASGCGGDSTTSGPIGSTTIPGPDSEPIDEGGTTTTVDRPGQDPAVNDLLRSYVSWSAPTHEATDGRTLAPKSFTSGNERVECAVSGTREIGPVRFDDFAAFVFDGRLLPGHIVRGDGVMTGDLSPVGFPRAPVTLQMDLASASPTIEVDSPTEAALTEAVARLKLDADERTSGIDLVRGDLIYDLQTTSSYEESLLQMGISARYASRDVTAGFSSSFDQQEDRTEHSVTMRLLQPMYTISIDRSSLVRPGDFAAATATGAQMNELVTSGRIAADAPPLVIDQVTYGRSVYVTASSTEVRSSDELRAAVDGAFGSYSGEASARHRQIMESDSTRINVRALGGDQEVALNALRQGEIKEFLQAVNVANASPLTFSLRTLDGTRVAIEDSVSVQDLECTRTAAPKRTEWIFEVDVAAAWAKVYVNNQLIKTVERDSSFDVNLTPHMREGRSNDVKIWVWPDTCLTNPNIKVRLLADGRTRAHRSQDGMTCDWESTFVVNDADNSVVGPANWTTP